MSKIQIGFVTEDWERILRVLYNAEDCESSGEEAKRMYAIANTITDVLVLLEQEPEGEGEEEVLVYPAQTYRHVTGSPDDRYVVSKNDLKGFYVGMKHVTWAAAPGTGRTVYRVTRIDDEGVWGVVEEDTVRILEPWETE